MSKSLLKRTNLRALRKLHLSMMIDAEAYGVEGDRHLAEMGFSWLKHGAAVLLRYHQCQISREALQLEWH